MNTADHEAWMRRELDQLRDEVENCRGDFKAQGAILADAQVRVAVLEAKDPVTRDEFDPIKRIVWGMVMVVLGVVLAAILSIVVVKPTNITSAPTITGSQAHP